MSKRIVPEPIEFYKALAAKIEFRDGVPYRTTSSSHNAKVGDVAGCINVAGYRQIGIAVKGTKTFLLAHRLHWFMVHGEIPNELDHRDRDKRNNRIENLRLATSSQNKRNMKFKNTTSEFQGVCWHGKGRKWMARIQVDGTAHYLGLFANEKDAARAYDTAAVNFGVADFAILNFPTMKELARRTKERKVAK